MTKKINKKFKRLFRNFKSFSLVELIIVIAIIAILSVAGFMTLTKWIGKSRNSRRISDLKNIEKALTINYTEKGKYPTPSNNGGVNYSGSTLWKQGTFGKETIDKMDEFTVVPKDPLTKTGYDYSVTENQKEYEVSAALERIGIAYTDIRKYVDKVYAGDYYSKVLGNYDSLSLGVKTGNNCYTLSIPSIIISDFTGKNIEIEADGSKEYNFVMEGGKNIGPSYKSVLKKEEDKGTKFGVKSVYLECEIQDLTGFNNFSSGLHMAYSGEKITETPSFDHSIGDIGNSEEDVEVRTESYKELKDSDIITLSNDVSEEIEDDINSSEESGGGNSWSCGENLTITVNGIDYTYSTKQMDDGKCWTTDNMKHGTKLSSASDTPSNDDTIEKWCYNNDSSNCETYGGLYSWNEAMGWGSNENEDSSKSVCGQLGDKWRLPTDNEWHQLEDAYKNEGVTCNGSRVLKWECDGAGWDGNKLGGLVSSLPGFLGIENDYYNQSDRGYWWSSIENDNKAYYHYFFEDHSDVNRNVNDKIYGFSVVCLQK